MPKTNSFSIVNPNKSPFFYGYVILVIGTIGIWFSIPGQTVGVSVFTDPVKDALGLSRNQFSNAYMIGTICSSLLIGKAGKWFDVYGARYVAFFAAITLSIALFLCSWSVQMSTYVKDVLNNDTWLIPFVMMVCLFFLLRFAGQGVLTMASRNMIMIWFDKNRGKVNSFSSIALSFGFSSSPLWLNILIEEYNWQGAWQVLAIALLIFSVFIFQLYKNKPEDYNLLPDGQKMQTEKQIDEPVGKQYTLNEAKKTRAFWVYGLILAFNSFFITGLTFHVVSVFASEGMAKEQAIAIFLPCSVVSVIVSTLFNFLSDYVPLKWYLYAMIFGGVLTSLGFVFLSSFVGVVILVIGIGVMGGFFSVLNAIVWPRFYGRTHLGAISGKIMGILILASALAPSIFSGIFSAFSSYKLLGYISLLFLAFLSLIAIRANNPKV